MNPFFESMRWRIDRPEGKQLLKLLAQSFETSAKITAVYRAVPALGDPLNPLNLGQPPRDVWLEALDNLAEAELVPAFCDVLRGHFATSKTFQAAVDAVVEAQSELEKRVLAGGIMVVDRAPLRGQIALLGQRGSPVAVLLVRGEPKSGKSHGHYLFETAAREAGAQPVYVGSGMVVTVDDLIFELFSVIGATKKIPKRGTTTPEAWYRLVCQTFLEQTVAAKKKLWIAVDDLGPGPDGVPLLDDEIRNFCDQFALRLQASQYQDCFRLMLIHYPAAVPTRWPTLIWKDDSMRADDITKEALIDFLAGWSKERGKGIAAERVASLTDELLAELDAPPAGQENTPRLTRMYERLTAMTQGLEQP